MFSLMTASANRQSSVNLRNFKMTDINLNIQRYFRISVNMKDAYPNFAQNLRNFKITVGNLTTIVFQNQL